MSRRHSGRETHDDWRRMVRSSHLEPDDTGERVSGEVGRTVDPVGVEEV